MDFPRFEKFLVLNVGDFTSAGGGQVGHSLDVDAPIADQSATDGGSASSATVNRFWLQTSIITPENFIRLFWEMRRR